MKPTQSCDFQIRLPLTKQMVEELNTIARSKFSSRLAIIRAFIQRGITEELDRLIEYHNREVARQRACEFTANKLMDLERRKRDAEEDF